MANSYLARTPSSTGNRKTFTFSAWVKRSKLLDNYPIMFKQVTDASNFVQFYFDNQDRLVFYVENGSGSGYLSLQITNRKFRDVSAWYHVMVAVDTTQASADNRVKIYVNGNQETSFSTNTQINQNIDVAAINTTGLIEIGRASNNSSQHFNGYMTHVSLVDGQQLAPTVFGQTDSTSGIWKFKSPSGVTWGTNGFHLKFENSGNLGLDSSGQTNNFTVNGNLKQALDTPSNVHATLNSLNQTNSVSCINGNTTLSQSANDQAITGTLGFTTGKWYWEMYPRGTSSNHLPEAGIVLNASAKAFSGLATATGTTQPTAILRIFNNTGSTNNMRAMGSTTNTTVGASVTYTRDSDYINVAVDADAGKIWFGKNGTYEGGGDPAAGTNPTYDWSSNLSSVEFIVPALGHFAGADQDTEFNFGNGYFGITQVSSAQNPDDGIGIFEYDVPTGYRALCTKSINAEEYS